MSRPLILAFYIIASVVHAAEPLHKAYLCEDDKGNRLMVNPQDLPKVRDMWCRVIEYRHAQFATVRKCETSAGIITFSNEPLFRVEKGCAAVAPEAPSGKVQ